MSELEQLNIHVIDAFKWDLGRDIQILEEIMVKIFQI